MDNKSKNTNTQSEKSGLAKKVGDVIERVGEKADRAGLHKVGEAISKVGDKIEHAGETSKKK